MELHCPSTSVDQFTTQNVSIFEKVICYPRDRNISGAKQSDSSRVDQLGRRNPDASKTLIPGGLSVSATLFRADVSADRMRSRARELSRHDVPRKECQDGPAAATFLLTLASTKNLAAARH